MLSNIFIGNKQGGNMIIRENIILDNIQYVKTYSDKGFYIERDGVQYSEAIDPIEFAKERIYIETDIPIESAGELDG